MITTDRDRKLKVGKAIKNERQNILCYLSTPACTCTINCLHAWPPDSSSMVYKQYLLLEFKLNPFGIAVTCDEQQWKDLLKHILSCLLLISFIKMALEQIFLMLDQMLLGYQTFLSLNISLHKWWSRSLGVSGGL